jgi:predicted nucleotidyltransferase
MPEAADLLRSRFGASRVVLFGSLARGDAHEASDVDLAVLGVPVRQHFAAAAALEQLLHCTVDLVRIEAARPEMLATLAEEGREF